MPNMTRQVVHGRKFAWLGTIHGLDVARTGVLKVAAFTAATHYPDGFIRSGTALTKDSDGTFKPYVDGDVLYGFLADDITVGVDPLIGIPVLDHGRVVMAKLPIQPFTPPAPEANATTVVFA